MKIFVSCSNKDLEQANKLAEDLKNQSVTPWIYVKDLRPGAMWLKQIDDALSEADYVLGVITENYISSLGGIEAYIAISDGLRTKNIRFLPLFFSSRDRITSAIIKALQGFDFFNNYDDGLRCLIEFLKKEEPESAKITLSKVEGPESSNPFHRVRMEFFRDNYRLIAKAFAIPEKEKYELLQEERPIVIFGGRGSGKSMILKSLTPQVLLHRLKCQNFGELRKKGVNYLGFYFRIEKGSLLMYDYNSLLEMGFAQTGLPKNYELYKRLLDKLNKLRKLPSKETDEEPILTAGFNAVWAITLNEFNFKILKMMIIKLKEFSNITPNPIITLGKTEEEIISRSIFEKLGIQPKEGLCFKDLIVYVDQEISKISNYVQNLATPYAIPEVNWCRTNIKFLDEVFKIVSTNIDELKNITFYLLLDEFENFRPIQQTIIIEWIKTAQNFVVKVASKFEGMFTNMTLQGQPLQFGQDCPQPIELDYNLFDRSQKANYQKLLKNICYNILDIEGYAEKDISNILEVLKEPEIPQKIIDEEIRKIRLNANLDFDPNKIDSYRDKLKTAVIFRILRQKRKNMGRKTKKKVFAGFETYTYLSSGIVRIFLNLVGLALYKAEGERINVKNGEKITVEQQTWSAYITSKAWLEKIPENSDVMEQGEKIYHFIVALGEILNQRLLYHSTEPECLAITIVDPQNLTKDINSGLRDILVFSEKESLLYKRKETSAYKPKQFSSSRGREYVLNRIYAPVLGLSYRARWGRNRFSCNELRKLLNSRTEEKMKKELSNRLKNEKSEEITLFDF